MKASYRYVVRPCDNDGSIEGLVRDRTWDVVCKDGAQEWPAATYPTRREAYAAKRELEEEGVQS
jgi:hypothetical protein